MRKLYVKMIILFLCIISINIFYKYEVLENLQSTYKHIEQTIEVSIHNKKTIMTMDDYLEGVIPSEMSVTFPLEALKAQAVASRTYVLSRGKKVDNTTATQVYQNEDYFKKKWGNHYDKYRKKIQKVINETKNEVITYKGEYISALFFSSSNGKTMSSEDYYKSKLSYLRSVESPWDIDSQNTYTKQYSESDLKDLFKVNTFSIDLIQYLENGYVDYIKIEGKKFLGREVREKLNLSSSSFTIKKENKNFIFTCSGYGHGVGMSQFGAKGMAEAGYTYKDILNHYYKNIQIVSI